MVTLDVVIVNWNTGRQLRECLEAIAVTEREVLQLDRVVVVDNASSDNSADGLEDMNPPIGLVRNPVNLGFAAGCNIGAKGSEADYLLFLNPDTRLFSGSLTAPVSFMESEGSADVGVLGIQLVDGRGAVMRTCARHPTPAGCFCRMLGLDRVLPRVFPGYLMADWDHLESRRVDHVTGAFFLVRRGLYESMGGFDERFFVYLEDLDFNLRVSNAGWSCYYLAGTRAFHRGGGASEGDRTASLFHAVRSRILFCYKHFSRPAATSLALGSLFVEPAIRILFAAASGSSAGIRETIKGYSMIWRAVPGLFRRVRRYG